MGQCPRAPRLQCHHGCRPSRARVSHIRHFVGTHCQVPRQAGAVACPALLNVGGRGRPVWYWAAVPTLGLRGHQGRAVHLPLQGITACGQQPGEGGPKRGLLPWGSLLPSPQVSLSPLRAQFQAGWLVLLRHGWHRALVTPVRVRGAGGRDTHAQGPPGTRGPGPFLLSQVLSAPSPLGPPSACARAPNTRPL